MLDYIPILLRRNRCIAVCFFKQKTGYEMRISAWSSDVCSSDRAALSGEIAIDGERVEARVEGVMADLAARLRAVSGTDADPPRSEERRVGTGCVRTCRSGRSPDHKKNNELTHDRTRVGTVMLDGKRVSKSGV